MRGLMASRFRGNDDQERRPSVPVKYMPFTSVFPVSELAAKLPKLIVHYAQNMQQRSKQVKQ